ncbi:MAG TPA: hypothetical protein DCY58_07925, partial [Acetobacterium sp.]|nr:hypothetical protein [Acetobacterium sp.]
TAAYDLTKPAGQRVYSAKVGGVDLDPNRTYTLACNNYLATSKDYPGLQAAAIINEYSACDEAFINYLQNAGNDRFMAAINTPNVTAGAAPQPVLNPQSVQPGQKQSANNPRTGYGQWGRGLVLGRCAELCCLFTSNNFHTVRPTGCGLFAHTIQNCL